MTLTQEECVEVRARYESGATQRELASELCLSQTTVAEAVRMAGGSMRPKRVPFFGTDLGLARRLARRVTNRSITVGDFAERMGCSRPTARKLIHFVGGKTPRD